MNVYTHRFAAICPANGKPVGYTFTLTTSWTVKVEQIQAQFTANLTGYHEDIADKLYQHFGGEQVLEACHHGTHIRTMRP